ncbi:MAG: hypothetical protein ACI89E_000012 [Planctomycetota bacterium]|jgi:hypothetical protein
MKEQCFEFRSHLSSALEGPTNTEGQSDSMAQAREMENLGWHEHLLQCAECRQLLEGEQILDELLGSLPDPELSQSQRESLVLRLAENLRLERWLDVADPFDRAPVGLSERILQGVRASTQAPPQSVNIDGHLAELDHVEAPVGLAGRVMRQCQENTPHGDVELTPQKTRPAHARSRGVPLLRHWLSTGLVAASLAAFLWYLPGMSNKVPNQPSEFIAETDVGTDTTADAEVLALLDTLEVMDLVDELDAEEWEQLDQYDSYALFLTNETATTDGEVR